MRAMWSGFSKRPGKSSVPDCFARNEKPRGGGAHCKKARRRYCFLGASVPDVLPLPEPEGLVEGEVEGLVMLPALPPVLARASVMHFSRSVPVSAAHFAGTSVEELAEPLVPLDGLSL